MNYPNILLNGSFLLMLGLCSFLEPKNFIHSFIHSSFIHPLIQGSMGYLLHAEDCSKNRDHSGNKMEISPRRYILLKSMIFLCKLCERDCQEK